MTEKPGNPDNGQASHPPLSSEARATWGSTLIAAFSALISLVALGIGLYSAHLVEQQNSNSQQQALLSLVTDIQQGQQAPPALTKMRFPPNWRYWARPRKRATSSTIFHAPGYRQPRST